MNINTVKEYEKRCGTPFYVFNGDILEQRIKSLQSRLSKRVELCYAIKANPFITKEASKFVGKLEICSEGEYRICEELKLDPKTFVISGVNKNPDFIRELIENRVNIGVYTVESEEHFSMIESACNRTKNKVSVIFRLTSGNQFGLDEEVLENLIKRAMENPYLEICGIQYFSGTQKTSLKKLKREFEYVDGYIEKLQNELNFNCKVLEFGPGFPVFYFEGENFDEDQFISGVNELIDALHFKGEIIFELGRSIAASCGQYVAKVADIKRNCGENYAILDGGMHQITYYGQFMAMKHPKIQHLGEIKGEEESWTLCGSLCSVNDLLVKQYPLRNLQKGDYLVFKDTGAYCMTEGISLFLSRDIPAILLEKQGEETKILRERFLTHKLNIPNY